MRRWILRTLCWLAIGASVTCVLSWTLGAWCDIGQAPIKKFNFVSNAWTWQVNRKDSWCASRQQWIAFDPIRSDAQATRWLAANDDLDSRFDPSHKLAAAYGGFVPSMKTVWTIVQPPHPPTRFEPITEDARGFPFLAMAAALEHNSGVVDARSDWSWGIGLQNADGWFDDMVMPRCLPLRPLPFGFTADSMIFAALGASLVEAARSLRRALRRRRYACVKCGYDLAGLAAGATCPECGKGMRA